MLWLPHNNSSVLLNFCRLYSVICECSGLLYRVTVCFCKMHEVLYIHSQIVWLVFCPFFELIIWLLVQCRTYASAQQFYAWLHYYIRFAVEACRTTQFVCHYFESKATFWSIYFPNVINIAIIAAMRIKHMTFRHFHKIEHKIMNNADVNYWLCQAVE